MLAAKGVKADIRYKPGMTTYWLSYDPTDQQKQENEWADRGDDVGKIKRETVNSNDWYSSLSGYRFGAPVILLDLASQRGDNPMAEALDGDREPGRVGILWPQVSEAFPGKGRAVVQGVRWAFAPRVPAVVIQAWDVQGLMAGAEALADVPDDTLTRGIQSVKERLWRENGIPGEPIGMSGATMTAKGRKAAHAPQPFAIRFPGERPLPADQVKRPAPPVRTAVPLPAVFGPKQFIPYMHDGQRLIEAGTAEMLFGDSRFSEAIQLLGEAKQPGKMKITVRGVFRYSDRKPCWQAQWEDIIELREKLVPKERRPMEFEVRVAGKAVGKLVPVRTETREVQLELASPTAALKPRTDKEEVVTQLSGEIELGAGRQEILLVHRNMVDGKLEAVGVGMDVPAEGK